MKFITLSDIQEIAISKKKFVISEEQKTIVKKSFEFLSEFAKDKVIYGINTGFGPMAQFKIDDEDLNQLQYNLIRSHSSGIGEALTEDYSRAVILARVNSFLQGKSGISPEAVEKLVEFLNNDITPEIFEHGGVGASGDLVQLAHLGLNLIGEGNVFVNGVKMKTSEALKDKNIEKHHLQLRDGLSLINGTSCMTAIGAINLIQATNLLKWSVNASSMLMELVESFDDSFSLELNQSKKHKGQMHVANQMNEFLSDSKRLKNRVNYYKEESNSSEKKFKKKVQEYYSLRCIPQILGPVHDTLEFATNVIENELNSTNDNPIVDVENQNVFHGGNFHGDYISLEMDKIKIVMTKLSILSERQLNFLLNPALNDMFPAFLNKGKLGFNFGLQGVQFTATSTVAESQTLSFPNYVHSIPNNNDNQDIVSMGTNSALFTKKVIENGFQVMAILMIAICQAIDFLSEEEKKKLSSNGIGVYNSIRKIVATTKEDIVQNKSIEEVVAFLKKNTAI
jgi:histidine ammonia-lyase